VYAAIYMRDVQRLDETGIRLGDLARLCVCTALHCTAYNDDTHNNKRNTTTYRRPIFEKRWPRAAMYYRKII